MIIVNTITNNMLCESEDKYKVYFLDIFEFVDNHEMIFDNKIARKEYERYFINNSPKELSGKIQFIDCYNKHVHVNVFSNINKVFQQELLEESIEKLFDYFKINKIDSIGISFYVKNKKISKKLRELIKYKSHSYDLNINLYKNN